MEGSGDGQLHRVTLLKALGRCELSRAFRGLPLTYAATRGFLVAAGPAKGAKVFDALRERRRVVRSTGCPSRRSGSSTSSWKPASSNGSGARNSWAPRRTLPRGQLKRAARGDRSSCGRRRGPAAPSLAARDIRLDGEPAAAADEVDLAAFAEKCALRVHPDRRSRGPRGTRGAS